MSILSLSSVTESKSEETLDFEELQAELAAAGPPSLTPAESRLLRVKALYALAMSIAAVFLNLYLFNLAGLSTVVRYCTLEMVGITLGFVVGGVLLRRVSSVRVLQAGALASAAVFVCLLVLGESAPTYVLVLGALAGFGEGLFWTANNLSEYAATTHASRNRYYGRSSFWQGLAGMFGPPLAGSLVMVFGHYGNGDTHMGYNALFVVMCLTLLAVAFSARKLISCTGLRFQLRQTRQGWADRRWQLVLAQQFFNGMWGVALPALTPILLLQLVHGEMLVSLLTAASAVTGAMASRIAGSLLHGRPNLFVIGSILVPVAMLGFATQANWLGVFCIVFMLKLCDPFAAIPSNRATFDALESAGIHWRDSFHSIVQVEVVLNAGRILSFLAVLAVVSGQIGTEPVRHAIFAVAVVPLLAGFVQTRLNRLAGANC